MKKNYIKEWATKLLFIRKYESTYNFVHKEYREVLTSFDHEIRTDASRKTVQHIIKILEDNMDQKCIADTIMLKELKQQIWDKFNTRGMNRAINKPSLLRRIFIWK